MNNPATITDDQIHDIQMGCFRLEALLRTADSKIDSLPVMEDPDDRQTAEDARLIIQSARVLPWQVTNVICKVDDFGEIDKPYDL